MALDSRFSLLLKEGGGPLNLRAAEEAASSLRDRTAVLLLGSKKGIALSNGIRVTTAELAALGNDQLALYTPPLNPTSLLKTLNQLSVIQNNPYDVLEQVGILVISPIRWADGIQLSGGSYSEVKLQLRPTAAVVRKVITNRKSDDVVDGIGRHRLEAAWIMALPDSAARLFPQASAIIDDADRFGFEMTFFPAYSVAELVFQERLTGSGLATILMEVYRQLRTELYSRPPLRQISAGGDGDYLTRIRRRTGAMISPQSTRYNRIHSLVHAPRVRVNGRPCVSLSKLLEILETDIRWRQVTHPENHTMCHGDLILEDILIRRSPNLDFRLVDPNPYNAHPLFDVAKTMLSLWLGYEFVYFDLFSVDEFNVRDRGQVDVQIRFHRPWCRAQYRQAAEQFLQFVRTELAPVLGLDPRTFDARLRMAAALHALAIPSFHVLHHNRADRGIAFLSLGLYHATQALEELDAQ